jgi:hypothetical protein
MRLPVLGSTRPSLRGARRCGLRARAEALRGGGSGPDGGGPPAPPENRRCTAAPLAGATHKGRFPPAARRRCLAPLLSPQPLAICPRGSSTRRRRPSRARGSSPAASRAWGGRGRGPPGWPEGTFEGERAGGRAAAPSGEGRGAGAGDDPARRGARARPAVAARGRPVCVCRPSKPSRQRGPRIRWLNRCVLQAAAAAAASAEAAAGRPAWCELLTTAGTS